LSEAHPDIIDPFTLADVLEAGIVVHAADTAIWYANPKALELLRLTTDQALGKVALDPYWQFLDGQGRPMPVEDYPVNRVISGKAAIRDQIVGVVNRSGGRTTWVNVCAYPEYDGAKNVANVVVTFVDVTARIRSERLRKAQLDIAMQSNELDEERLLQLVLSWCEEITGSTVSFFHFVNDDQETIELVTWSERTLHEYCHVEGLNRHYPISQAGIWAEASRTKQPVVVNDYAQATNKRGLPDGHASLQRFISMPLLEGDMVRVLLGVGNKAYAYADDDVQDPHHPDGSNLAHRRTKALRNQGARPGSGCRTDTCLDRDDG
jgi:GAF domain/PAS fold